MYRPVRGAMFVEIKINKSKIPRAATRRAVITLVMFLFTTARRVAARGRNFCVSNFYKHTAPDGAERKRLLL